MEERSGTELSRRVEEALREADRFMNGTSNIQLAAEAIARHLEELGLDYAIVGALALSAHGFMRLTVDVDVLIRGEDLARFKAEWLGRGYVEVFPGSKAVRDTARNVKIDFLIAGQYPGDRIQKPVAFHDPAKVHVPSDRFKVVSLPALLELKLASGMSAPHRGQDLVDVQRLIHERKLPRELAEKLDPWVRAKFDELWLIAQHPDDDY